MMRKLDIPATAKQLTAFLKQTVTETGFSRVAIAVSGGIDSAVACTLAVRALGPQAVFPISLPYSDWHIESEGRTERLLRHLEIPDSNIHSVDIAPLVQAFAHAGGLPLPGQRGNQLSNDETPQIRLGNIMARTRMILLFDYARWQSALVLGTENKSEHYLGYYTRFGDEASDLEPLRNLYKTEIYPLAEYLDVPEEIRKAAPTAGLWQGQTDEGQFGFTYEAADPILYELYDEQRLPQELVAQGMDARTVKQVQEWVQRMVFKHGLPWVAPAPPVTS